MQFLYLMFHRK